MSKEAYIYEKIGGVEAYLAGVADVYTEVVLGGAVVRAAKSGCSLSLASDVYSLGENNEISIKEALKDRIDKKCFDQLFNDKVDIDKFRAYIDQTEFEKVETSFAESVEEMIRVGMNNVEEIKEDIQNYCRNMEWHLGKPLNIYNLKSRSSLFDSYVYIVFDAIIVEFEEYALMMCIGTND